MIFFYSMKNIIPEIKFEDLQCQTKHLQVITDKLPIHVSTQFLKEIFVTGILIEFSLNVGFKDG